MCNNTGEDPSCSVRGATEIVPPIAPAHYSLTQDSMTLFIPEDHMWYMVRAAYRATRR